MSSYYEFRGQVQGNSGLIGLDDDEARRRRRHTAQAWAGHQGGQVHDAYSQDARPGLGFGRQQQSSAPTTVKAEPDQTSRAPRAAAAVDVGAGAEQQFAQPVVEPPPFQLVDSDEEDPIGDAAPVPEAAPRHRRSAQDVQRLQAHVPETARDYQDTIVRVAQHARAGLQGRREQIRTAGRDWREKQRAKYETYQPSELTAARDLSPGHRQRRDRERSPTREPDWGGDPKQLQQRLGRHLKEKAKKDDEAQFRVRKPGTGPQRRPGGGGGGPQPPPGPAPIENQPYGARQRARRASERTIAELRTQNRLQLENLHRWSNVGQQAGIEIVHGTQRAERAEQELQQTKTREQMQAAGRQSAQEALARTQREANLQLGIGGRQLSEAHGKVQTQAKSLKEIRAQQVKAQQRAIGQQGELDTKDYVIGGLRRAGREAERGQQQTETELIHADHTIGELNDIINRLQRNARTANEAAAGHINMLLQQARDQKQKLQLKLREARTAPTLSARESASSKKHDEFVQPTLTARESARSETTRPRPRLQERRAAVSVPVPVQPAPSRAAPAAPRRPVSRAPAAPRAGGGPIIVQGAGGGGSSSSSGGAAGGAAASGGGARAPDLSKVVEAVKAIAESVKGSKAKKSEKGISIARRTYTDRRKTKIAELRALKSKRIREFAARTKKLPASERDKQRREFKKKVESQFREMQTRFPTARGLKSVATIRELIRKLQSLRTAK